MATARQLRRLINREVLESVLPKNQGVQSRVLNRVRVMVLSAEDVPNETPTDGMLLELYRVCMHELYGSQSGIRGMGEKALVGLEAYLIQRGIITDDRYKRILSFKGRGLYAKVHLSIPRRDLGTLDYRTWVDQQVITPWLVDQEKNPRRVVRETKWNEGVYVHPKIKGIEQHVGVFKADGVQSLPVLVYPFSVEIQGVYIENEFILEKVERVHFVADSLEATLKREGIKYERHNLGRGR